MSRALIVELIDPKPDVDLKTLAAEKLQDRIAELGLRPGTRLKMDHRQPDYGFKVQGGKLVRYVDITFYAEEPEPSTSDVLEVRTS